MPIEIRELHIRVAVNTLPKEQSAGGAPDSLPTQPKPARQTNNTDAIVAECVEQVLEILRNKAER